MKKTENESDKKAITKKSDAKLKDKKKPVKETPKPQVPVSDANSGYIPFGG